MRKTAVVTGSAGTLGRAFAVRLARAGWFVACVDVNEAENRETLRQVVEAGGEGFCAACDVREPAEWRALHDHLRAARPSLDLLVNNAGVAGAGEIGQFPLDDWQWVLDTNLRSVIVGCHTFADWLRENPAGARVINVASLAAFAALPSMGAYNVAKAGVLALSETVRTEWAETKVGVTVVCPGFFASGLVTAARMMTEEQRNFTQRSMDAAGFTADDVAAAALRASERGRMYVVLPRRAHILWWLKRWFPRLYLRLLARQFRVARKRGKI
ncbi:MAG: SDR family NAD(P)-dependent oxidoreductase [Planctomycetaceae bacterium]|nr:SDR family NAD(P)-dependent oxidoreductase [Planctomycetaceae bacterium]